MIPRFTARCAPRWSPWRTFVRDARKVLSFSSFSGSMALICAGSLRPSSSLRNLASRSCAIFCRGESFLARAGRTNSSGFASRIFTEPSSNYARLATIGGASDLNVQLRRVNGTCAHRACRNAPLARLGRQIDACRWVPPLGDYRLHHPGASAEGRSEPVSHRPTSGECDRASGGRWPPEPFVLAREARRAYARRMSGEPAEGRSAARTARRLVETLGGRYSAQLGIAVDQGPDEVERWFLAATLFGHRISAEVAMRTYRAIERAGIRTIAEAACATWDELVARLDEGGYVRYDFSTASRLLALAEAVIERHHGRISSVAEATDDPAEIEATLDQLPGWGPTTVRLFLRELRGVWAGARPPCDERARWATEHLGLGQPEGDARGLAWLAALAALAGVDPRDLESALVRLPLAHGRRP